VDHLTVRIVSSKVIQLLDLLGIRLRILDCGLVVDGLKDLLLLVIWIVTCYSGCLFTSFILLLNITNILMVRSIGLLVVNVFI